MLYYAEKVIYSEVHFLCNNSVVKKLIFLSKYLSLSNWLKTILKNILKWTTPNSYVQCFCSHQNIILFIESFGPKSGRHAFFSPVNIFWADLYNTFLSPMTQLHLCSSSCYFLGGCTTFLYILQKQPKTFLLLSTVFEPLTSWAAR